jgi:hypothetical protein
MSVPHAHPPLDEQGESSFALPFVHRASQTSDRQPERIWDRPSAPFPIRADGRDELGAPESGACIVVSSLPCALACTSAAPLCLQSRPGFSEISGCCPSTRSGARCTAIRLHPSVVSLSFSSCVCPLPSLVQWLLCCCCCCCCVWRILLQRRLRDPRPPGLLGSQPSTEHRAEGSREERKAHRRRGRRACAPTRLGPCLLLGCPCAVPLKIVRARDCQRHWLLLLCRYHASPMLQPTVHEAGCSADSTPACGMGTSATNNNRKTGTQQPRAVHCSINYR